MQTTLFEPTEEDLVNRALAQPLDQKIERAIMLLKHWESSALQLDPRGYWVADSFGKDSDCICELAKMAGVQHHCEHNLTTLDPPELVRYGKKVRPSTNINRPKMPLLEMMVAKTRGPPTRLQRWCCAEYKEGAGKHAAKVIGVRISESGNRKKLWTEFVRNRHGDGFYLCPIAYWTENDVWEFHSRYSLPYCELYDQGFTRLGCIGCPMAGPTNQKIQFSRWPAYERMWRRAFDLYWTKWHGIPTRQGKRRWFEDFGSPQKFYDWWRSGEGQGDGPQCQGSLLFTPLEEQEDN